jgi:hypothetical protein
MLSNPTDMKLQNYFAVSLEIRVEVELSVWLATHITVEAVLPGAGPSGELS